MRDRLGIASATAGSEGGDALNVTMAPAATFPTVTNDGGRGDEPVHGDDPVEAFRRATVCSVVRASRALGEPEVAVVRSGEL
jgi:hypothetical protein